MTLVEKISRELCWANGMNPDVTLGGDGVNFLWMEYEHQAEAAIKAFEVDNILFCLKGLYEKTEWLNDDGPEHAGWQSEELSRLNTKVRELIDYLAI